MNINNLATLTKHSLKTKKECVNVQLWKCIPLRKVEKIRLSLFHFLHELKPFNWIGFFLLSGGLQLTWIHLKGSNIASNCIYLRMDHPFEMAKTHLMANNKVKRVKKIDGRYEMNEYTSEWLHISRLIETISTWMHKKWNGFWYI